MSFQCKFSSNFDIKQCLIITMFVLPMTFIFYFHAIKEPKELKLNLDNHLRIGDLTTILIKLEKMVFILEPSILAEFLTKEQINELKWRYNITNELDRTSTSNSSLTLGIFDYKLPILLTTLDMINPFDTIKIYDTIPFSNTSQITHLFLESKTWKIHLVVLVHVKNFLWIGKIAEKTISILKNDYDIKFGIYEQIFEPFKVKTLWLLQVPDEIEYFLSQIPSSRYLSCSENKRNNWYQQWNMPMDNRTVKIVQRTNEAIISMKSLMKKLKMEFWMMCGTLLGWYRQCYPISYTTDTDFSTWPKYLLGNDISEQLLKEAPKHNLNLHIRFGEPKKTMEYSFKTNGLQEKIDLFFSYDAIDQFYMPAHEVLDKIYIPYYYPKYQLCSAELLGHKLLTPCSPESVILAEYGTDWNTPIDDWDWAKSPKNGNESFPFSFNVTQFTRYSY